jgi:BirA family biotin operon repressor/biotin-[acetyl-CoA-carboxylase] ligase
MTAEPVRPPLVAQAVRDGLVGPGRLWRRLEVVDETGSTNADLLARAAAGEDIRGVVLLAENQTAGRGRSGRTWTTVPRTQILMSAGVAADGIPGDLWGWVPLVTGVAVVDAVAATTGIRAGLKWPNDVLVDGGKLAGVLAEVAAPQPVIVVGVGLNVTLRPENIAEPGATSLVALGAEAPDRNELARSLLRELATRLRDWRESSGAALRDEYLARSITISSRVRAVLPGGREVVGVADSVDEQGRLCIDTNGQTTVVSAGDVVHLRPAHLHEPT